MLIRWADKIDGTRQFSSLNLTEPSPERLRVCNTNERSYTCVCVLICHCMHRQVEHNKFYVLPTQLYLCVLCGSQNSDYFTVQHGLLGFCNWDGMCLLRGTFYILPTQCVCVDLRTNSDYFTVQHGLLDFYNRDGVCLLRGTFYILRSAHTVFVCFV